MLEFQIESRSAKPLAAVTFTDEDGSERRIEFVAPSLEAMDRISVSRPGQFKFSKHVYSVLAEAAKPLQPDVDAAWFEKRLCTANLPVVTKLMAVLLPNEGEEGEEEDGEE